MACDGVEKVCKYVRPDPTFLCEINSDGVITNRPYNGGNGCGDWATPSMV
jgi:hypothetical protein